MKLLFLAHRIPYPPNKGDKIRSYHELRAFAEHGHEVHLLAFADDLRDLNYQVDLARWCATVHIVRLQKLWAMLRALLHLFTSRPLTLGYFGSWRLKRLVNRALKEKEFDAIFVYSAAMANYVPQAWQSRTVVDLVDVDSEKWREYAAHAAPLQAWLYRKEALRLRKYECEIIANFANTILTTPREAALLSELDEFTRRARLRIITNGVDLEYFQPSKLGGPIPLAQEQCGRLSPAAARSAISGQHLVFTGAMDYYANVEAVEWFVKNVFPVIRQQEPRTQFFIVGSNPVKRVTRLSRQPGVIVTGFVEDVRPYLHMAMTCVIPLQIARGVQNKLLEALATGKAVVATPEAAAGLSVQDGDELLVAGAPAEFAAATLRIIRDEHLRKHLEWRARRFVEARHDWTPKLQTLVELVELIAQRRTESESQTARATARY